MVKVTDPQFNVGIRHIPLPYAEGNGPNLQPAIAGLSDMANSFMRVQAEQKQKAETMDRYKALSSLGEFEVQSKLRAQQQIDSASPDDTSIAQKVIDSQLSYEQEFIKTLPPDMQPEFSMRAESIRGGIALDAHGAQDKLNTKFYENDIQNTQNAATIDINDNPDALEKWKSDLDAKIDASGLSEAEKYFAKQNNARILETAGYGATLKRNKLTAAQYTNDLGTAATQAARQLGISPVDLLTVISFETGGTFNVDQKGGKDGKYMGLIQFGPEEQKKYGIHPGMSVGDQMAAVVSFLQDRGFKPGMSIYDLYSTINAGSPGHYNASDAHNGGTPGTVADKVNTQMADHRAKAEALLGGKFEVPDNIDSDPRFKNVLYEDRVALQHDAGVQVNQLLAQQAADRKAQQAAMFNELENGLNDGRYGAKDIEAARAAGWLTDYDQINKAQTILEEKAKKTDGLATFMTRIERGYALDPNDKDNKEQMQNLFEFQKGEDKLQGMDEEYVGTLGTMFRSTGMVPESAVKTLGAMTRSADNRKMFYAFKALNALEEMNPDGYAFQVPETLRNKADVYDVLRYTVPENELFKMLRDNPDAQQVRAQQELRDLRKQELESPNNKSVTFQTVLDHFGADQAEVGVKGQVMQDEWKSLLLWNASQGMSLEQANEKAIVQLGRKWGNSTIDGVTTLMRNPPEKYYKDMTSQQLTDQLRGQLGLGPNEKVQLVSDARTEADIAAGRAPTYIPMIQQEDGVWVPATGYPEVKASKVGMLAPGNIDIHNRPMVKNPNGGISTVDSMSYEEDGKNILIPLVSDEGKIMTAEEAIPYWKAKGQNLGVFDTAAHADEYAQALHDQQDMQYLQGLRTTKRMYFQASPLDKAKNEAEITVKNFDARIKELEKSLPQMRAGKVPVPGAVASELARLKQDRAAAMDVLTKRQDEVQRQYLTPAQSRLQELQKQFAPLNSEMQSWTDPIEEWPKVKEWEQLYDQIEKTKAQVEQEVLRKRSGGM